MKCESCLDGCKNCENSTDCEECSKYSVWVNGQCECQFLYDIVLSESTVDVVTYGLRWNT